MSNPVPNINDDFLFDDPVDDYNLVGMDDERLAEAMDTRSMLKGLHGPDACPLLCGEKIGISEKGFRIIEITQAERQKLPILIENPPSSPPPYPIGSKEFHEWETTSRLNIYKNL